MTQRLLLALWLLAGLFQPALAQSLSDWPNKAKFAIDTTPEGGNLRSALQQFVLPVRLHTGNFDFKAAKPDGSDLRFVAADGKTVLPHRLEAFDAANELAVAWVQVPSIAPASRDQFIWVYSGNPKADAPPAARLYDARTPLVVRFGEPLANEGGGQAELVGTGVGIEPSGVAGRGGKLAAGGTLVAQGTDVKIGADGATASAWVRGIGAGANGAALTLAGERSRIEVAVANGVPSLRVAQQAAAGAPATPATAPAAATAALSADRWQLLAVVVGADRVVLLVDGAEVGSVAAKVPEQPVRMTVGGGPAFDVDDVVLSTVARVPEYLRATFASQGPDNAMIGLAQEEASEISHFKILVDNLTLDGKIVIYLLAVMFVIATWVIIAKAISLQRAARANARFLEAFRSTGDEAFLAPTFGAASVGAAGASSTFTGSPLYAMFEAASGQVRARVPDGASDVEHARGTIGPKSMASIRAAIDATLVREGNRLNRLIVLLTIAISGGPFIGLLGTVVGVMITFAAIAAAGDVNINAIAPGIAAALLATVAGLAVAIPALFAYNWLAAKIKELVSEMQIFSDELVSRIAETFER
jgi:biopolymer transport protein ExbB